MHPRRGNDRWRLLIAPPRSGAENMARDTALLARARRTGEIVFSVYSWSSPTLSLGRNQPASRFYDRDKLRAAGIDVVRRPTGGRAILHHREVTYSVTAPLDGASLRETYGRINRILQSGLSRLGVFVETAAPSDRAAAPSIRPCFELPAEGELVAEGAKLVGSAQWRDRGALLQHGSILVDDDQSSLPDFTSGNESLQSIPAPATLHRLLGREPDLREVASAMFAAVRSLEDEGAGMLAEDAVRGETLDYVSQFLDEGWTWRR